MTVTVTYTNGKRRTYKNCTMVDVDLIDFAWAQERINDGATVWDSAPIEEVAKVEIEVQD